MKRLFILLLFVAYQIQAQQVSTTTLYNDAIDAHAKGNIAQAVYNLELASLIRPYDSDIQHNLEIVKRDVPADIIEIEEFFILRWIKGVANLLSPLGWKILVFVTLAVFLGLLYLRWIKKHQKWYTSIWFLAILLIAAIKFIVFGNTRQDTLHGGKYAIIMEQVDQLKEGPDQVSKDVKLVSPGVKLHILDQSGDWYEVAAMDREQGWIPKKAVKVLSVSHHQ